MADGLCLLRIGAGPSLLEVLVGPLQEWRIEAGRNFAIGRARSVNEFGERAVRAFHDSRIQRILFLEAFQVLEAQTRVERVRTRLNRIFPAGRALGNRHRLKSGLDKGSRTEEDTSE